MSSILLRLGHLRRQALLLLLYCLVYVSRHIKKLTLSIYPWRLLSSDTRRENPEGSDHPVALEESYNDYAQFSTLSKRSDRSNQVFVSLELHTHDEEKNIAGLGLCTWRPNHISQLTYIYWSIANTSETQKQIGSYAFRTPTEISESDIRKILDDHLNSLTANSRTVVLVAPDIRTSLKVLDKYWQPSQSLIILDTDLIWQHRHQIPPGMALSATCEISPDLGRRRVDIVNARDTARILEALHI